MKECSKCLVQKELNQFPKKGKYFRGKCKQCTRLDAPPRKRVSEYPEDIQDAIRRKRHGYDAARDRTEYDKNYYIHNIEKKKQHDRQRYYSNREDILLANKLWHKKNSSKVKEKSKRNRHIRRARLRAVPYERIASIKVWSDNFGICHICLNPVSFESMHLEHVVPLSRGGAHVYDNLRPSHPLCNLSKGTRLMGEFNHA